MQPSNSCVKSHAPTLNPKRLHSAHSVTSTALKSIALVFRSSHKAQETQNKTTQSGQGFAIVQCLSTLCCLCLFVAYETYRSWQRLDWERSLDRCRQTSRVGGRRTKRARDRPPARGPGGTRTTTR